MLKMRAQPFCALDAPLECLVAPVGSLLAWRGAAEPGEAEVEELTVDKNDR